MPNHHPGVVVIDPRTGVAFVLDIETKIVTVLAGTFGASTGGGTGLPPPPPAQSHGRRPA